MRGRRVVRVGGLLFESHPQNLRGAFQTVGPEGLKDWLGGGNVVREEVKRAGSHGAFDLPGTLPQKVIPFSGHLVATSAGELQHMIRRLLGLLADGESGRMVVDDDMGPTWRDVRIAVQASCVELDEVSAKFEMSFWAADPRAYGESRVVASGSPLVHYGNSKAWPTVTVTGAGTAYSVTSQGRTFSVSSPLPSGSTDVIDMSTGRVVRNGSLLVGGVSAPRVWGVPAGGSVAWSVSGASASVLVTDTFI